MFVSIVSSRRLQGMSSRRLQDMSSRRLQDVFKTCLETVFETSWRPTNACWDYFVLRETILLLKSKLSVKFQRFNAIDESIEMLKNSWILRGQHERKSNFNQHERKSKTFYEAQTASRLKGTLMHIWKSLYMFVFI